MIKDQNTLNQMLRVMKLLVIEEFSLSKRFTLVKKMNMSESGTVRSLEFPTTLFGGPVCLCSGKGSDSSILPFTRLSWENSEILLLNGKMDFWKG